MLVKVVLGTGLALVAGLVLVLLLSEGPRRSGSNYVPEHAAVTELRGGDEHCELNQLVPGDTGVLRLQVGTYGEPTPELRVTVTTPERGVVSSGRLPAGSREGHVLVPLTRVDRSVAGARVCIRTGPGRRSVLYGRGENVRLAWMRPGSESRLAMLPTIAHRLGLAKLNPFGSWLLVLVTLALAAAWFVALRLVLRKTAT
jgi:hypothetical protein